ncbi:hypothetical protein HPB49_004487 [Dermacentor silvarum]|uniref:Uncharacterized protein n=1 Tax=Dermacentor silvarum TaxID=543639 RepID=A0ACB8DUC8_DERSI|nr:hypothetical protein HPB49_004487 [Dermacentor silvarum]
MALRWISHSFVGTSHLHALLVAVALCLLGLLVCFVVVPATAEWIKTWLALRPLPGPWDGVPFWFSAVAYWNKSREYSAKDAAVGLFSVICELCETYKGKTFKAYMGMLPIVVLHTPEAVEPLLSSKDNLAKPDMYNFIAAWLGPNNLLTRLSYLTAIRGCRPWLWMQQVYDMTKEGKVFKSTVQKMQMFSYSVLRVRKEWLLKNHSTNTKDMNLKRDSTPSESPSLFLDALLAWNIRDPAYSIEEIKNDVDSIIFAGTDSTASGVSWTIYLLGLHPSKLAKVHEELDRVLGRDKDGVIRSDDLLQLNYLECCLKESLRLYPPFPLFGRKLEHDMIIDGYRLPKGLTCFVNLYSLHRDPRHFRQPDSFFPERFLGEEFAQRHPYSYIPFSAGPKNCLGKAASFSKVRQSKAVSGVAQSVSRSVDKAMTAISKDVTATTSDEASAGNSHKEGESSEDSLQI